LIATTDPPETVSSQIFPWIEQEQEALLKREHGNRFAKDIALRQFLNTLAWFRRILIQDMAVLFTQNPHAPIFKVAPFDSPVFREFASNSAAAIHAAEETARLAFQNLPEHLVASMRGALAMQNLAFERERQTYQGQMQTMQSQLGDMHNLLQVVAGSKRTKKAHSKFLFMVSDASTQQFLADLSVGLDDFTTNVSWNVEDPSQAIISGFSNAGPSTAALANPYFDPLSPAFQFLEDYASDNSPSINFNLPPIIPTPAVFPLLHPTPTPDVTVVAKSSFQPTRPLAGSPEERLQHYFQRYGEVRFRKHSPEWLSGDWVPHYKYATADAIWDYWVEWKEGLNGFIGVEELTTTWGAKWRRNNAGLKSENTRRMRVINLILELSQKPHWNVNLVRRFVTEKYASHYRARAFADFLAKGRAAVITTANNYP
jgi:hypothetical protein